MGRSEVFLMIRCGSPLSLRKLWRRWETTHDRSLPGETKMRTNKHALLANHRLGITSISYQSSGHSSWPTLPYLGSHFSLWLFVVILTATLILSIYFYDLRQSFDFVRLPWNNEVFWCYGTGGRSEPLAISNERESANWILKHGQTMSRKRWEDSKGFSNQVIWSDIQHPSLAASQMNFVLQTPSLASFFS